MKQPELGKKISELRKEKGLTQEELVELCNVNVRTIQRIESGEVTPRSYTLKTILKALNSDFDEIKFDVENSISVSKSNLSIIKWAFWIGIIYVLVDSFNIFLTTIIDFDLQSKIDFSVTKPLFVFVQILSAICAIGFYFGFFTIGKVLKNSILKVSSLLFGIVATLMYLISAFLYNPDEFTSIYFGITIAVFYGAVGIPFGIGILKLQKHLGQYTTVTGIFTIILYATMFTIILAFISLFLWLPVMILQLILLYKIREYLQNR